MNTDQLKSFIQVAENLNFARAAEILNITQSAVSRQIHSLEEELGTRLLHRTTRTVSLTLVRAGYGCSILPSFRLPAMSLCLMVFSFEKTR